jgi:hypothetical protein
MGRGHVQKTVPLSSNSFKVQVCPLWSSGKQPALTVSTLRRTVRMTLLMLSVDVDGDDNSSIYIIDARIHGPDGLDIKARVLNK